MAEFARCKVILFFPSLGLHLKESKTVTVGVKDRDLISGKATWQLFPYPSILPFNIHLQGPSMR